MVAKARWPKNPTTIQLEPHREELLKLRQAGESVAALAAGLRGLDIEISDEALRLWLNRELGRAPAKRTKRPKTAVASPRPLVIESAHGASVPIAIAPPAPRSFAAAPVAVPTLVRPGETPLEALRRREAERAVNAAIPSDARPTANREPSDRAAGAPPAAFAHPERRGPKIARDDF